MCAQGAGFVPDQFLGREPARALHVSALNLADVQRRVQRGARVMQDVSAQNAVFAGQRVDHHFGAGGTIGEVVERPPASGDAVPFDVGRFVESRGRKADAVFIGRSGGSGKGDLFAPDLHHAVGETYLIRRGLVAFGQMRRHAVADRVTGVLRGHPVEV